MSAPSEERRAKQRSAARLAASWLGLLASVGVFAVAFVFLVRSDDSLEGGSALLPRSVSCRDGSVDQSRRLHFQSKEFDIYYREKGCNSVAPQTPVDISNHGRLMIQRLRALRLPPPRTPVAIELTSSGEGDGSVEAVTRPGANGALVIDLGEGSYGAPQMSLGIAELMLSGARPAIPEPKRFELAAAYAELATEGEGGSIEVGDSRRLADLIRSKGVDFAPEQLEDCPPACSVDGS